MSCFSTFEIVLVSLVLEFQYEIYQKKKKNSIDFSDSRKKKWWNYFETYTSREKYRQSIKYNFNTTQNVSWLVRCDALNDEKYVIFLFKVRQ